MVDQQDTAIFKRHPQPAVLLDDDRRLAEMGYPRRLSRRVIGFDNFAISFTIISILTGCMTLLGYGMITGGPAVIVWGWILVGGTAWPTRARCDWWPCSTA